MVGVKSLLALLCAAGRVALAQAGEATAPADSDVVKLTSETFESVISENPLVLVEFYAPWCGHCKNLAPEYVKAAEELKKRDIVLAQIDCTENQDLCMQQQIPGYPTMKVYKDKDLAHPREYNGGRTAESIVRYMVKQGEPVVTVAESAKDLEKILSSAALPVVVDYGLSTKFNATFYSTANKLSDDFSFVSLAGSKDAKEAVVVFPTGSKKASDGIAYNGDTKSILDEDEFTKWVRVETLPYFGEIDGEVFASYVDSKLPLAYLFHTTEEEKAGLEDVIVGLAKEYRGKINFVSLDATKYGKHADNLNMKQQFPLFVIHDMEANLKYGLPQYSDEEFEKKGAAMTVQPKKLVQLVKDFSAGKAQPIVKSEEVPETQETNVYKLVGTTHDDITSDPKKDVLVKYYAPWCGHCKRMAPAYQELADVYASDKNAKDKIVIAEIDATANDISGLDLEGYPTVILYPAGKKSKPVTYQGNRSIESFFEFIQENGASKVDGQALHKKFLDSQKVEEVDDEILGMDEL